MQDFDALSEKYSVWIIKYCSLAIERPIFLIWYTDTDSNSTDRLLSFETGEIFSADSLITLKPAVLKVFNRLVVPENLLDWLENFDDLDAKESATYDIASVINGIEKNDLRIRIVEDFANFCNLYDDFANQDPMNEHLLALSKNDLILEAYNYYYDFIFWPRFNDGAKFKTWNRPELVIDTTELAASLSNMITAFESNLKDQ